MRVWWGVGTVFWAQVAAAGPLDDVMASASAAFDRMPRLEVVEAIAGNCGADVDVNEAAAYCTTSNVIYIDDAAAQQPEAAYLVAHLLGHAVQVQHGIADVALREITQRRAKEAALRGDVAGQVDCIAGFLYQRAGLRPASLTDWFDVEPFGGTHWGRNPLRIGPQVQIGLETRNAWFQTGQRGDLAQCAVGAFEATLLLRAFKG